MPWCEIARNKFDEVIGKERSAVIFNSQNQASIHGALVSKLLKLKQLNYRVIAEFHASSDKELFSGRRQSEDDWTLLKNGSFHHFNPRFGPTEKWLSKINVQERLSRKGLDPKVWIKQPRLVFRDIARNDDTRTLIPCLVPPGFVSTYDAPMLVPADIEQQSEMAMAFYAGYLTSFFADFIIRPYVDKHIKGYVLAHVPIPEFSLDNPLMSSAAELALSVARDSWLAHDQDKQPSVSMHSHPQRIALEAMYLHIVGVARDEIQQMLTGFGIIQADELRRHKEFRTQRLILEAWDKLEAGDLH